GFPLHSGPAGSRSAHPYERRNARQQLPAVADRIRRDLGHRHAVARFSLPPSARGCSRLSKTRSTVRGHQACTGAHSLVASSRVLSGAVLIAGVVAALWWLAPIYLLIVALVVVLL